MPSVKVTANIGALIARDVRVSLEPLREPREVTRAASGPTWKQIKRMEENCTIPCRTRPCRLTHVSRNYSSIYRAKVKFQRQFRGRVAMGKVTILSWSFLPPLSRFRSVYPAGVEPAKCDFVRKHAQDDLKGNRENLGARGNYCTGK